MLITGVNGADEMDELVELVQKKVGLSEKQAALAVNAVIGFLKERFPEPVAKQMDVLLASEEAVDAVEDLLDQGMSALSGMLGKKED